MLVPRRPGPGRRIRLWLTRSSRRFRASGRPTWGPTLLVLTAVCAVLAVLTVAFPTGVPASIFVLVIVLGGFFLPVRGLALLYLAIAVALLYVAARRHNGTTPLNRSVVLLLGVTALLMVWIAHSRARLGVQGTAGESMLVDLRDRLRAQGELPVLPRAGMPRSSCARPTATSSRVTSWWPRPATRASSFELALVDVSGKGAGAGTRALLLSGALGGLLGAMPPEQFLAAANDYLLRQRWTEGFATAVHVAIDLRSGDFTVDSAGHPPAVHFQSGSGRWAVLSADAGPLLGVLPDATYPSHTGAGWRRRRAGPLHRRRRRGPLERPVHGIDRMLGQADLLITGASAAAPNGSSTWPGPASPTTAPASDLAR